MHAFSARCRRQMIRVNTLFKYVCYHPMEHQVLTTGTDRKVGYWETYDGSMIRELDGSLSGSVNAIDISTDGTYFVSGGDDKLIKVCFPVGSLRVAFVLLFQSDECGKLFES